jgi:hypothetical protein
MAESPAGQPRWVLVLSTSVRSTLSFTTMRSNASLRFALRPTGCPRSDLMKH